MIGTVIRTLIARLLLLIVILIFGVPILIFMFVPERLRYGSRFFFLSAYYFYTITLRCLLLPIKYVGLENIPDREVMFVANHQSSLDIPIIGSLTKGKPHIWLALSYLMQFPMLRFILPRIAVLVDPSNARKAVGSLLQIMNMAKKYRAHMLIFPEGGRFIDDKVHDFFGGFAILANKTEYPVVPVYIHGVNKAYPPDRFWLHYHPITVVIGKPFIMRANESNEEFKDRVYAWFSQQEKEYCS